MSFHEIGYLYLGVCGIIILSAAAIVLTLDRIEKLIEQQNNLLAALADGGIDAPETLPSDFFENLGSE